MNESGIFAMIIVVFSFVLVILFLAVAGIAKLFENHKVSNFFLKSASLSLIILIVSGIIMVRN